MLGTGNQNTGTIIETATVHPEWGRWLGELGTPGTLGLGIMQNRTAAVSNRPAILRWVSC